jgi:hypothetical protein
VSCESSNAAWVSVTAEVLSAYEDKPCTVKLVIGYSTAKIFVHSV